MSEISLPNWKMVFGLHSHQRPQTHRKISVQLVFKVTAYGLTPLGVKASESTMVTKCVFHIFTGPVPEHIEAETKWPPFRRRHLFKCIFSNENVWIPIKILLKFVPMCPIDNIPVLVLIMAWHIPGAKPLSEPMMVSLLTHICVTRPQWVNV